MNSTAGARPAAMIAAVISGLAFAGSDDAGRGPPPTSPSALEGNVVCFIFYEAP